jgi:enolase
MNVINGGVHAENRLQFQEFMIAPGGELLRRAQDWSRGLSAPEADARGPWPGHGGGRPVLAWPRISAQPSRRSTAELADLYCSLCEAYPIGLLEDGMADDDRESVGSY